METPIKTPKFKPDQMVFRRTGPAYNPTLSIERCFVNRIYTTVDWWVDSETGDLRPTVTHEYGLANVGHRIAEDTLYLSPIHALGMNCDGDHPEPPCIDPDCWQR